MRDFLFRLFLLSLCCMPCLSSPIRDAIVNDMDESSFRTLLRKTDWKDPSEETKSLLHFAVEQDRPLHLQILLEYGRVPDRFAHRIHSQTAIELSVVHGRTACFRVFWKRLTNPPSWRVMNSYRWTLLHLAVFYQRIGIITMMLDDGFDVNQVDWKGWTALDVAEDGGFLEAALVLRARGGQARRPAAAAAIATTGAAAAAAAAVAAPELPSLPSLARVEAGPEAAAATAEVATILRPRQLNEDPRMPRPLRLVAPPTLDPEPPMPRPSRFVTPRQLCERTSLAAVALVTMVFIALSFETTY